METGSLHSSKGIEMYLDEPPAKGARIKVIGVGGGGSNAVNRMIESGVKNVEFIVANTDLQALNASLAPVKLQLGTEITRGLGAGANPEIGLAAAFEDRDKIIDTLIGADMVFITTGLGGGTGTGAAPVIATIAAELSSSTDHGILTVGVVTKPFEVEGRKRMRQAEKGLAELRGNVDAIITIPNSRLKEMGENISIKEAFRRADDVLLQAVSGISNIVSEVGGINVDFRDIETVMKGMGVALMGIGTATGEGAVVQAMKNALDSKLLEENSIKGARGALINITGSEDMPLNEIEEAINLVYGEADEDANIIFGTVYRETDDNEVSITLIATGFEHEAAENVEPIEARMAANAYGIAPGAEQDENEDMEVPAFIRRQAD